MAQLKYLYWNSDQNIKTWLKNYKPFWKYKQCRLYFHEVESTSLFLSSKAYIIRGGSRAAATSKMEFFVIIVNGFQPLTIIIKHSILYAAAALDPPLIIRHLESHCLTNWQIDHDVEWINNDLKASGLWLNVHYKLYTFNLHAAKWDPYLIWRIYLFTI